MIFRYEQNRLRRLRRPLVFLPVSFGAFLRLPSRTQDGLNRQSLLLDNKQQAQYVDKNQFFSEPIHVPNILQKISASRLGGACRST